MRKIVPNPQLSVQHFFKLDSEIYRRYILNFCCQFEYTTDICIQILSFSWNEPLFLNKEVNTKHSEKWTEHWQWQCYCCRGCINANIRYFLCHLQNRSVPKVSIHVAFLYRFFLIVLLFFSLFSILLDSKKIYSKHFGFISEAWTSP